MSDIFQNSNFSGYQCLIVEDRPQTIHFLNSWLTENFKGLEVVLVTSCKEAKEFLEKRERKSGKDKLIVSLIDLGLPDGSGIEVIRLLKKCEPRSLNVVITVYHDDGHLFESLAAGAYGYILKDDSPEMVIDVLKRLTKGEPPLSPSVAHRLLSHFYKVDDDLGPEAKLTPRETETLTFLAKGLTVPEVAKTMGLSAQTVASYVKIIYQKLHVSNRVEATHVAIRRGLL
jgi:DNA-binding NarL/FixJ family response regulator